MLDVEGQEAELAASPLASTEELRYPFLDEVSLFSRCDIAGPSKFERPSVFTLIIIRTMRIVLHLVHNPTKISNRHEKPKNTKETMRSIHYLKHST